MAIRSLATDYTIPVKITQYNCLVKKGVNTQKNASKAFLPAPGNRAASAEGTRDN